MTDRQEANRRRARIVRTARRRAKNAPQAPMVLDMSDVDVVEAMEASLALDAQPGDDAADNTSRRNEYAEVKPWRE